MRGYLDFDASSNTASLMTSVKNAMSVAATTYAIHCMSVMVVDLGPQEIKEDYIDPVFDYAQEVVDCSIYNINQMIGEMQNYFG